jgi:choline-glycine betaine transporter
MKSTYSAHQLSGPSQKSLDQEIIAMQITVARYGARHWAVYLNGQLLAVTVYKKGALAVQDALRPSHSLKNEF